MNDQVEKKASWIVKLAIAFLWIFTTALWLGIITTIIAHYIPTLLELSKYWYEK